MSDRHHPDTRGQRGETTSPQSLRLGCVSFLNARPLIEHIEHEAPGLRVRYDVPSRLLADLEAEAVDLALCPVIDYQRSNVPLVIVPAGGIGSEGPTLTVRLYSRVPFADIKTVHADTDSHTSVCLLRVLLDRLYACRPSLIDLEAGHGATFDRPSGPRPNPTTKSATEPPGALLLIGDKVVTSAPPRHIYPHQMDLGEAWHEMTGLPFVFAIWMARAGFVEQPNGTRTLAAAGDALVRLRRHNAARIDSIVTRRASRAGWPENMARDYLGQTLQYDIGPRQMKAIEVFFAMAYDLGAIEMIRPLRTVTIEPTPVT